MEYSSAAFWNVNVPASQHTDECPEYLTYAFQNAKDRETLGTPDDEYQLQTWPEVKELISGNRLDLFTRVPSELRRYRMFCSDVVQKYGTVMSFVMLERLQWIDLVPHGSTPFEDKSDYKILYNDWPYGIDPRITHLVVWTKFSLSSATPISDTHPDDLDPPTRQMIDDFVQDTFSKSCGAENVIWFKNWSSLKSIHAVEHFHVMIFKAPSDFIKTITNGDRPWATKVHGSA